MTKPDKTGIPGREAWGDFTRDYSFSNLETKYAFNLYGGRSVAEAMPHFLRNPIDRAGELGYVPWDVFVYYVSCFTEFLTSDASRGEADYASTFLHLLLTRSKAQPQRMSKFYPRLKPTVELVAGRQAFYDADVDIYGLFSDLEQAIEAELS